VILRVTWICALVALVGVAVANVANLARTHPPAPIRVSGSAPDPVMNAEARFAPVRAELQARAISGRVGYFSDAPAGRLSAEPRGIERYFRAQFALSPLILDVDGRDPWIVTDFEHVAASRGRIPAGWQLAADCGGGVLLWHQQHPRP